MSEMSEFAPGVELSLSPDGRLLYIKTPYNKRFVEEIRTFPGRRWDGEKWIVPVEFESEVRELLKRIFPPLEKAESLIIKFIGERVGRTPNIDGIGFISFARDWVRAYSRPPMIEVLYQKLESGGSRRYPWWSGVVILRYSGRPEPDIAVPEGCKYKILYKGAEARRPFKPEELKELAEDP